MMAAYSAAANGCSVTLLEKNEKLGKKLYITGKGRCNLTNMAEPQDFFENICSNGRFFRTAYRNLDNTETFRLFENMGLPLKEERGKRVFPRSDKSSDVIRVLERQLHKYHVEILLHTQVRQIRKEENAFVLELLQEGRPKQLEAQAVVIATGGLSYPSTGSTGDGYRFAESFGHSLTPRYPSLVSLQLKENVKELQGLSLRNVTLRIWNEQKCIYEGFGEMLFTDKGISGPLVLSASTQCVPLLEHGIRLQAEIDLKPALELSQLRARLQRECTGNANKQSKTVLHSLMPASLVREFLRQTGVSEKKTVGALSAEETDRLLYGLKHLRFTVTAAGSYAEAVITKGGVSIRQVTPGTMESKRVPGLYFAGEVLDLDARTGGFNLQIAWSTGYTAGCAAANRIKGEQACTSISQ